MNPPGPITIVRCGGIAEHWRTVVERCERGEGQTLKQESGNRVIALPGQSGSAGLVIKRSELRSFGSRIKAALRTSRAWRHWKGAARLTKAGVRTAACYAIARSTSKEGAAVEWLIMDRLPGKTLLQHLADGDLTTAQEHALADEIGKTLAAMFRGGLWNRDGKPSNWIVTSVSPPAVAIIDCVAIIPSPANTLTKSLGQLAIEPIGCGCFPRFTLAARVVRAFSETMVQHERRLARDNWRWHWSNAATEIRDHGDPTPKVNPLQ